MFHKIYNENFSFEHSGNKYSLNGAATWNPRQKIAVDLFGDYVSRGVHIDCRYSCSVQSTLSHIPNINTTLQHFQNGTDYNTIVHLMVSYHTFDLILY